MTPTAFSRTRLQKSCTTSKPTSASSNAVRTSLSASSTVASSSSATPWNFCLAVRNPFVSVSNIGAQFSVPGRAGLARPLRLHPPRSPPRRGVLALALGEVEVVAEVLAGHQAQLLGGGEADLGGLVGEAVEEPVGAVLALVALP